jgi:hypothetical protein
MEETSLASPETEIKGSHAQAHVLIGGVAVAAWGMPRVGRLIF